MANEDILPDFQSFLRTRNLVPEKNIPFYALWANRFIHLCNVTHLTDDKQALEAFSESLNNDRAVREWQFRQAEQAARLYLYEFKGKIVLNNDVTDKSEPLNQMDISRVIDEMRRAIRLKHYSYKTERAYVDWANRFFSYVFETGNSKAEPLSNNDVRQFLTHLAIKQRVAASTQNQAFNAILFLFSNVLGKDIGDLADTVRAKRGVKLPVVLSIDEIRLLFENMPENAALMTKLLYGAGLRLMELARLRVQDIDFSMNTITVRDGKGSKDRTTLLPAAVKQELSAHLAEVRKLHEEDLAVGHGEVYLPDALERKYPTAGREWKWQYVFPASNLSVDPRGGKVRRHHISDTAIQAAVKLATSKAGINKRVTVHTLRHSFATHLLMNGVNIREIQELLGHKNVETTMIYTHVLKGLSNAPKSPLDALMQQKEGQHS
jgi:integron integrase